MPHMTRRLLSASACVLVAAVLAVPVAAARGKGPLPRRLAAALRASGASWTRSAAVVVDLRTGRTVYAQNPGTSLRPASNEKLAISCAALEALGPWYRIETAVLGRGHLVEHTWRGDLILRGRGDPTVTRSRLTELVAQLRDLGVGRVTGSIVADASFFDSRRIAFGWKPSFYINESPPISALAVDRSTSVDPPVEAAAALRRLLREDGIAVRGGVRAGRADSLTFPLASILSPPLSELVRAMNSESDNYTAELLIKQLGAVIAHRGTTPAGAAVVTRELEEAGVDVHGIRIVDGSGLSRLDRLTAGAIVNLLRAMWADPFLREPFLETLAIAGLSGTLDGRMEAPPARGNVLAKTGTTNEASALSGFVKRRYVFSILQNGDPIAHSSARISQDRFARILAGA